MWTTSQILTIIGLFFEFISVFLTIRQAFYSKTTRIEKMGETWNQKIKKGRHEGAWTLTFLVLGMGLQGIAVFVK